MNKLQAIFNLLLCTATVWTFPVLAGENAVANQEEIETLFGTACERIDPHESKASIRLRATDKATFEAVRSLNDISALQNDVDSHDLNVLIYDIVDNFVEDLGVQTTQQDDLKICVEITGYVERDNVLAAISRIQNNQGNTQENTQISTIEPQEIPQEPSNLPVETKDSDNAETHPSVADADTSVAASSLSEDEHKTVSNQKLLYIAPLEFFNNTQSTEYAKILNTVFEKNPYFTLTDNADAADYVISSKVLRAKVDSINSDTNRMQMVISVGATLNHGDFSVVEHQNRFILFASNDNEQKVAAQLMQKLLTKAAKIILKKVEKNAQIAIEEKDTEPFITPEKSS